MRLICFNDGIDIQHNGNEKNIETVFGLNDDDSIMQLFTFPTHMYPNQTQFQTLLKNSIYGPIIQTGFLFYSFRYQISFAHFMMQTVPLLRDYLINYNTYSLLIPKHSYNILCKEIIELCGIPDDKIILLEDNIIYTIDSLAPRKYYNTFPDHSTNDEHMWIYSLMRKSLPINNIQPKLRKVYLKRDGIVNNTFGNSETGIIRRILNEDLLIKKLEEDGFEIITLGTKHIYEKYNLLNNIHILITQLGANCMNLVFANSPTHCIFLSNDSLLGKDYYIELSNDLNQTKINHHTLQFEPDYNICDPLNNMNNAFSVSIEKVIDTIHPLQ